MSTTAAGRRGLRDTSLRIALLGALFAAPVLVAAPVSAGPGYGPATVHFAPVSDEYDHSGYDRDGYNRLGYDRDGYDEDGRDSFGYDRDGYDRSGYNRRGLDREGYTREGCHPDGADREGSDRAVCDAWRAERAKGFRLPTGSAG